MSIVQLEAHFAASKQSKKQLKDIQSELANRRNSKRNNSLRANVVKAIKDLETATNASNASDSVETETPQQSTSSATNQRNKACSRVAAESDDRSRALATLQALTELTKAEPLETFDYQRKKSLEATTSKAAGETSAAINTLLTWTALEVLSPPVFRKARDLAGGDQRCIASLENKELPWETNEKSRPRHKLFYQVILGTLDVEPAYAALLERFGDTREERPSQRGHVVLGTIMLTRHGHLVDSNPVSISSFGWGAMKALSGKLVSLLEWPSVESNLKTQLEEYLRRAVTTPGDPPEVRPVSMSDIQAAYQYVMDKLQLLPAWVTPPKIALRSYVYFKDSNPPEPVFLNSFFLEDLFTSIKLAKDNQLPTRLLRYLGNLKSAEQLDLLSDNKALEEALSPAKTPVARWPSGRNRSLMLLQQAAVNAVVDEADASQIAGVNGPPGTGKTTLLRDLVAQIISERAIALARFDDPSHAFSHTSQRLKAGESFLHLYELHSSLRGFEIVVASSNNKAVENVSTEIPASSTISAELDLQYFKSISDSLFGIDTWGLVAAVLGNSKNRSQFRREFWWNEDAGLNPYLRAASGMSVTIDVKDDEGKVIGAREPLVVEIEKPPRNASDASRRWRIARNEFRRCLKAVVTRCEALEEARQSFHQLEDLEKQRHETDRQISHAEDKFVNVRVAENKAVQELTTISDSLQSLQREQADLTNRRPGILSTFFATESASQWEKERVRLKSRETVLVQQRNNMQARVDEYASQVREAEELLERLNHNLADLLTKESELLTKQRESLSSSAAIDSHFFDLDRDTVHLTTPWFSLADQELREALFSASMKLHRSFIDSAAKPIRNNIGALMRVFTDQRMPSQQHKELLPHLWSTLFLVVPVVSTTFASVHRMLGQLPVDSLGWLLVDEAGQAVPQAAVGAMLRTQKAVFVGDPIQLEPVVTLPDQLISALCKELSTDPNTIAAPTASAQTLADSASHYQSQIATRNGFRTVGLPLLVHRRCSEPMFSIANEIAYNNLMVNAKSSAESRIEQVLGPSRWIDICGEASSKWCPDEGNQALLLLRKLKGEAVDPDLYILSPFVIVSTEIKDMLRTSGILEGWVDSPDSWIGQRVGTVHKAQGREAEAVILLLGAPLNTQTGARNWAGCPPNLLNVAVTRSKSVIYVIGNRSAWKESGSFQTLSDRLP